MIVDLRRISCRAASHDSRHLMTSCLQRNKKNSWEGLNSCIIYYPGSSYFDLSQGLGIFLKLLCFSWNKKQKTNVTSKKTYDPFGSLGDHPHFCSKHATTSPVFRKEIKEENFRSSPSVDLLDFNAQECFFVVVAHGCHEKHQTSVFCC